MSVRVVSERAQGSSRLGGMVIEVPKSSNKDLEMSSISNFLGGARWGRRNDTDRLRDFARLRASPAWPQSG